MRVPSLLALLLLPVAAAAQTQQILPQAYATRWGEGANLYPFGVPQCRYQQVHLGTEIGVPTILYGIGFREDETYAAGGGAAQMTIKLGLTSYDHNTIGLTSSFDANYDSGPATTVVNGIVNLPVLAGRNQSRGVFAVQIPFVTPWIYTPQAGRHLLWEVIASNSSNTGYYDYTQGGGVLATCSRIWATSATATQATTGFRNTGLIVSFGTSAPCVASFTTFGSGCAGSNGTPLHTAVGRPSFNSTYRLTLANALPNSPTWLFLAPQRNTWGGIPLPLDLGAFGAPSCSLLVPGSIAFGVGVNGLGIASVPVIVPPFVSNCGVDVYTQFVIADPSNNLGLVTSNGGHSILGYN